MRCPRLAQICFPICIAALALSGCGSNVSSMNSGTPAGPTGPAPVVAAMGVQTNGVAPNRWIYAQFNEAMDPATINRQTFTVADSSGKLVSGNVAYYADYNIAGFQPSPALQESAKYTVTLSTGIASAQGVHLASAYIDSLTTRSYTDTSPLTIKSVSPAPNATCVSATAPITITFNEGADVSTVNSANITITGPNNEAIAAQISYDVATAVATLTPSAPLPSGNITVRVQNVADAAGVPMPFAYGWNFSTACNQSEGATGKEYLYFQGWRTNPDVFYAYAIDPATGNLSPVPNMPFQFNASETVPPVELLADPLGRFLFYYFDEGFGTMNVDPTTGTLTNNDTLLTPSIVSLGLFPTMSTDPQGRFIYAGANSGNNLSVGAVVIGSDGHLSLAPGQPFPFPGPYTEGAPAVSDQFVYVSDNGAYSPPETSKLYGFSIDQTTGALSEVNTTDDGYFTEQQVITPSGKFLYAVNYSSSTMPDGERQIVGYQVNSDGSLTPLPQPPQQTNDRGGNPALIMSPNGNFLYYIADDGFDFRIYAIDQNTGTLSLISVYNYDNDPQYSGGPVVIDPAVKYVYMVEYSHITPYSSGTLMLVEFAVNPNTGALTRIPGAQYPLPVPSFQGSPAHETMVIVRPQ